MTSPEALRRVQEIRDAAGDDESAHALEDALRHDVLLAIAEQKGDAYTRGGAANLAHIALLTSDIRFARWYA